MLLFLAVMLTDIMLLDLFNTFGMPTSTTVSIVFELLGASVAIAAIKVSADGQGIAEVSNYINSGSALAIISGIFLSVSIAFVVGALVQWLSRILFSFHYLKRLKWVGAIWSGLAMSALTYFLLIKGAKGASFLTVEFIEWVDTYTWTLIFVSLAFWTILFQLLWQFFQINMLRIVVLFGTFSLAMAFAGNDLVNFIGVPIAGFESYLSWIDSGVNPADYEMGVLKEAVRTPPYLLVIAGAVMIVTLWFSKKARSVTETEVNLGRQDDGSERFRSNALARVIVRISRILGGNAEKLLPESIKKASEQNFKPITKDRESSYPPAAFDLVRASVNLTTASMLIAFATSLKLPLSTTYVSFMVAMGTSLADRAWGRDSAVFRVAGVLNVIGGWFLTAIIAFTVSGVFALCLYLFREWALAGLLILGGILIHRTFLHHRRKQEQKADDEVFESREDRLGPEKARSEMLTRIQSLLITVLQTLQDSTEGLLTEDRNLLQSANEDMEFLKAQNDLFKQRLYRSMRRLEESEGRSSRLYLLVYDLEQDLLQSIGLIVELCTSYVADSLSPLQKPQIDTIRSLSRDLEKYFHLIERKLLTKEYSSPQEIANEKRVILNSVESYLDEQVAGIKAQQFSARNSNLYFSLLLEIKDLIGVAGRFYKILSRWDAANKSLLTKSEEP